MSAGVTLQHPPMMVAPAATTCIIVVENFGVFASLLIHCFALASHDWNNVDQCYSMDSLQG